MTGISESQTKVIKQLVFNCIDAAVNRERAKTGNDISKALIRLYQSKQDLETYLVSIRIK